MQKTILVSLVTIGLLASVIGVGTYAYFSDTETSTGNTMTAGTLDLKVWDGTAWSDGTGPLVTITDMKPSYEMWSAPMYLKVVDNPAKLWMRLANVTCVTNGTTEPELATGDPTNWLPGVTDFQIRVDGTAGSMMKMGDIIGAWLPLTNTTSVGQQVKVEQYFHLVDTAGNEYQSDQCTFNVEFLAHQTNDLSVPLVLENKNPSDWSIINDGRYAVLNFIPSGPKFVYDLKGYGLTPSTQYSLIYYADPWPGNHSGAFIAQGSTDGSGGLSLSGSVELGMNLASSPDANHPWAKIWLVPSSNYSQATTSMIAWNPADYLFETRTIQYDDTDV
jgi:predicted ribosomally synthesized peptide with SipW-like signal peptide